MSISTAATQSAASGTTASAATTASIGANALSSLTSNFNSFLNLLMTQLQNQDPTAPMDSSQFTTELVQFTGVQQQISTNSSLTQLIQLTQSNQVLQSAAAVGHQVAVQSAQVPLQNGTATVQYSLPASGAVQAVVSNAAGTPVYSTTLQGSAGPNSWSWNGKAANGSQMPNGAYTVALSNAAGGAVPFNAVGTVTGVVNNAGTLDLQLGSLAVPFSALQSMLN
jgi:flagellar basal-body rod modification protein FlgD